MVENLIEMYKECEKMNDYVESVFNVFQLINKRAQTQDDKRLKMISLSVYNYVRKMANDNNIDLKGFEASVSINLEPIFEYIYHNNIELYDFSDMDASDIDTTKNADIERFVLTHIYYITQPRM